MNITIYTGFSKPANSTKQPTGGTDVSCTLKSNVSVIDPIFILDRTDSGINYVKWGNRYYFVTDVVYVRATTIELHCHVDALATYKSQIGASAQYVTRSASSANNYVVDNMYPLTTDIDIVKLDFDGLAEHFNSSAYVVGVIGQSTGLGIDYYKMDNAQFANFLHYLYGGSYLDAPITEISLELQKELVNPFQYIVSVQWFPCDTWTGVPVTSIPFGFWEATEVRALKLTSLLQAYAGEVTLPYHPQSINTDRYYLYNNPYTRIKLSCFTFGELPIDASYFVNNKILDIAIGVDYATGTGELYVLGMENGESIRLYTVQGQVGVPMQISQITQNLIQSAVGVVSSIGATLQGNFIGTLSGVGDAVSGLLPQTTTKGSMASRVAYMNKPRVDIEFRKITSADTIRLGKPLMQNVTINSLSGFIQVEKPDVDIVGTVQEKDEISAYMADGFFYE